MTVSGSAKSAAVQVIECPEYGTVPIPLSDLLDSNGDLDINEEVQGGFFDIGLTRPRQRRVRRGEHGPVTCG